MWSWRNVSQTPADNKDIAVDISFLSCLQAEIWLPVSYLYWEIGTGAYYLVYKLRDGTGSLLTEIWVPVLTILSTSLYMGTDTYSFDVSRWISYFKFDCAAFPLISLDSLT